MKSDFFGIEQYLLEVSRDKLKLDSKGLSKKILDLKIDVTEKRKEKVWKDILAEWHRYESCGDIEAQYFWKATFRLPNYYNINVVQFDNKYWRVEALKYDDKPPVAIEICKTEEEVIKAINTVKEWPARFSEEYFGMKSYFKEMRVHLDGTGVEYAFELENKVNAIVTFDDTCHHILTENYTVSIHDCKIFCKSKEEVEACLKLYS